MSRIFAVVLVVAALSGCLSARGTFTWSVTVDPLEPGAWIVSMPLPVGAADPQALVQGLAEGAAPDTVAMETTPDEIRFLQMRGGDAVSLMTSVPVEADVPIAWQPLHEGVPKARLEGRAGHVRVVDQWEVSRGGSCLRGEALGAILVPGETLELTPLPEPC